MPRGDYGIVEAASKTDGGSCLVSRRPLLVQGGSLRVAGAPITSLRYATYKPVV